MGSAFMTRQLVSLALTANAYRPVGGRAAVVPAFFAGWLTSELSPQLFALGAADTAREIFRGRAGMPELAAAAVTLGGMAMLTHRAYGSGRLVESHLVESLGEDYHQHLPTAPTATELRTSWREVVRPFRMRNREVEVVRDIQYAGRGPRGRLDIFRPAGREVTGAPVLVQVHGGAWMISKKEQQGQLLMNRLASRGWVCVAINYRLAPKHPFPAQIIDTKRAIAWTREHIGEYGGDATHIVITGGSAGGHLSALAALTPGDPEYQPGFEEADTSVAGCVPFYGVYDLAGRGNKFTAGMRKALLEPLIFRRPFEGNERDYERASPLLRVTEDAPDFYVLHGELDSLVEVSQARSFVAKLKSTSRRSVTYTELPGTQHAFEVFSSIRSQHVIRAVERWLGWHYAQRHSAETG